MRVTTAIAMLSCVLAIQAGAECLPFTEAAKNIGASICITGKVLKVARGESGTYFLNFCPDYRGCAFQIVVFPADLHHVGDIRQLEGKIIEVQGEIMEYDGHPEIILKDPRQLRGEAARIPPLPKKFDVENKGRYSAGKLSHPTRSRRKPAKRQTKPIETAEEPSPEN